MNAPIAPSRRVTTGAGWPAPSCRPTAQVQGPPGRPSGFSLVELMVAMALGLLLMASLGYVLLGAKSSTGTLDALSRMQENARFAFETMAKDIRMAGFTGGPVRGGIVPPVNVVNAPAANTWDPNLINLYAEVARGKGPLAGYDAEAGDAFPLGVVGELGVTGDALTIVHADTDSEFTVSAHAEPAFTLQFDTNRDGVPDCPTSGLPKQAEIFVASDYTHSAVFQINNNPTCAGGIMTLNYGTSGVTPGNSVAALGPFNGDINARKLYRLSGVTYHIRTNPGNEPALYRLELGRSGTTVNATAVEVIEGVENMQIEYGEDTTDESPNPQVWQVNVYRTANNVANWNNVLSARVTLTLVSQQETHVTASDDGLLRKTFTNTIAVRNRLL